jgi:hypothetical protein
MQTVIAELDSYSLEDLMREIGTKYPHAIPVHEGLFEDED